MKYLLDTHAIIALFKSEAFRGELRRRRQADVVVSVLTLHELYFGAFKGNPQRLEENLARITSLPFAVLELTAADARRAGVVRVDTRRQPIGAYDVLIAAQALERGLVLVTHNTGEFRRVPGLVVEDWVG